MNTTLIPAYKDYKTAKSVKAAWHANMDFRIANHFDPNDGQIINKEQTTENEKYDLRFNSLTGSCTVSGSGPIVPIVTPQVSNKPKQKVEMGETYKEIQSETTTIDNTIRSLVDGIHSGDIASYHALKDLAEELSIDPVQLVDDYSYCYCCSKKINTNINGDSHKQHLFGIMCGNCKTVARKGSKIVKLGRANGWSDKTGKPKIKYQSLKSFSS